MNIIGDIEQDGAKVLHWLVGESQKIATAEPRVVAALEVLGKGANAALTATEAAVAAGGVNIVLDIQTATDLKAVWPDVVAFLATLGVKV